jgi:hypothetical protein
VYLPLPQMTPAGERESRCHQIWQRRKRAHQLTGFVNHLHVTKPRKDFVIDHVQ